jgi:SAM-dependent methyltransferase
MPAMAGPDLQFWEQRFAQGDTPWDRRETSPQLLTWLDAGALDGVGGGRIAVPGCGSGHEVATLAARGFDVIGLDYAPAAVAQARGRLPPADAARVQQADVLRWSPEQPLAAVYEQTCLCALHPDDWLAYAIQLQRWLRVGGQLFALLMQARRDDAAKGLVQGPPYHCDINAMRALFPASAWHWPAPPYAQNAHQMGWHELAVVLTRR